ncbi:hypothetical protein BSKO_09299 [Bryopsis sp. KO-2023]|nr:hypothetical protein BSKO_09299 [Bryopsis sp. KO-2023]
MGRNQKKQKYNSRSGGKPGVLTTTLRHGPGIEKCPRDCIYFVADTSALISNYHGLVNNLKSTPECTDWKTGQRLQPVVVIPWIVLCEMDKLKEYKYRTSMIVDHLLEFQYDPLFRFETLQEFKESQRWGRLLSLDSNDDKVLQTCLYFGQEVDMEKRRGAVLLLTDDHMLKLRAQVIGVRALGSGEVPNSDVELLTAYCESMALADVFKEQVLKAAACKNARKKRYKAKAKGKCKGPPPPPAAGRKQQWVRGRHNKANKAQVTHSVWEASDSTSQELQSSGDNNDREDSPDKENMKLENGDLSASNSVFEELLSKSGLLHKLLGDSQLQWEEFFHQRVSDFLALAWLGRLCENSLLARGLGMAGTRAANLLEDELASFEMFLLGAYLHGGQPSEFAIKGWMQDSETIKRALLNPRDWYRWNEGVVEGPYESKAVLEWAINNKLAKDDRLVAVDQGAEGPLDVTDFKTYGEILADVCSSGQENEKKKAMDLDRQQHDRNDQTGREESQTHLESVATSLCKERETDNGSASSSTSECYKNGEKIDTTTESSSSIPEERSFAHLVGNIKLVSSALGGHRHWYTLLRWEIDTEGQGNVCGPFTGGELLSMVLDRQIPANFKLEGTDPIGENAEGVPPQNELEFKTFHRVLLDAFERGKESQRPVVTI